MYLKSDTFKERLEPKCKKALLSPKYHFRRYCEAINPGLSFLENLAEINLKNIEKTILIIASLKLERPCN